jgi:hypothetical protein
MTRLASGKSGTASTRGDDATTQAWLQSLRRAGADRFAAVGLPTTKDEEWRLTNVSPIAKTQFAAATAQIDEEAIELARKSSFGTDAVVELVFVNGHFAPSLSREGALPRGASACGTRAASGPGRGYLSQSICRAEHRINA